MEEEKKWLSGDLRGIDIPHNPELQELMENGNEALEREKMRLQDAMHSGAGYDIEKKAITTYTSLIGYYSQIFGSLNVPHAKDRVVDFINNFAVQAGLPSKPPISGHVVQQLGLSNHPELNIRPSGRGGFGGGHRGGYGGRGGGGYQQDRRGRGGYGGGYGQDNRRQSGYQRDRHENSGFENRGGGWNTRGKPSPDRHESVGRRPDAYSYGDFGDDEGFGTRSGRGGGGGFGKGGTGRGGQDDGW